MIIGLFTVGISVSVLNGISVSILSVYRYRYYRYIGIDTIGISVSILSEYGNHSTQLSKTLYDTSTAFDTDDRLNSVN